MKLYKMKKMEFDKTPVVSMRQYRELKCLKDLML